MVVPPGVTTKDCRAGLWIRRAVSQNLLDRCLVLDTVHQEET
jgi:hypothetical protein